MSGTFLCTLLPDVWLRYAQRIANLLAPAGVLCGFFFLGPEDEPPPYPISQRQLDELLAVGLKRSKTTQWKIPYHSMPVKNVGKSGGVSNVSVGVTVGELFTTESTEDTEIVES